MDGGNFEGKRGFMTNREVLINSLKDKEVDECTVDYIACVCSPDCEYDGGSDHTPCIECKMKWLDEKWEG